MNNTIYDRQCWSILNDAGFWIDVSASELRQLARSGQITPETALRFNGAVVPAGKMGDLKFPEWMQPVGSTHSVHDRLLVGVPME